MEEIFAAVSKIDKIVSLHMDDAVVKTVQTICYTGCIFLTH